jgi:hypothetical protein
MDIRTNGFYRVWHSRAMSGIQRLRRKSGKSLHQGILNECNLPLLVKLLTAHSTFTFFLFGESVPFSLNIMNFLNVYILMNSCYHKQIG